MSSSLNGPLILCYDGSDGAKHAIEHAAALFPAGRALVLTVWQPAAGLGAFAYAGESAGMVNFAQLDRAAAEDGARVAEQGAGIAREASLVAEPIAVGATGPVWEAIIETAERHRAAMIVLGSRGLTGMRSILLGSVSGAVVHHAQRPVLVIHGGGDDRDASSVEAAIDHAP